MFTARHFAFTLFTATLVTFPIITHADPFFDSFEVPDIDGEIILGPPGMQVTFTGGEAKRVFIPAFYRTGVQSWMIDAGNTGVITFETPVSEVSLWRKDGSAIVASVVTVFDENDAVLGTFNGTLDFVEIHVVVDPLDPRINRIEVQNNAAIVNNYVLIDDFAIEGAEPPPVGCSAVTASGRSSLGAIPLYAAVMGAVVFAFRRRRRR